ncbi:MAG: helix-turn-helix transcriptional regulator [Ruminiclostridium sp.]|nr:helix-turn-helix transcriptional regulator [Ruminiclostridium sp.]
MEYSMVGKRIKEYRLANKMTQVMLAEKTGLSEMAIYSYETGKRLPALEPLVLLSNALNVSTDTLLCDYVENQNKPSNNGIMERVNNLPEKEQERILKIMDALVSAAG